MVLVLYARDFRGPRACGVRKSLAYKTRTIQLFEYDLPIINTLGWVAGGVGQVLRLWGHIRLLIIATLVWAGFLVGGLPSYYQQYSMRFMIVFDAVALVLIAGAVFLGLRRAKRKRRLRASLWLAFYFTVPLAIYDWIYCGVYLGHGMEFIGQFWYLSVYYIIPWIVFPLIAVSIKSERHGKSPKATAT